jgi:GNAT superfamily N-acetyltransferase
MGRVSEIGIRAFCLEDAARVAEIVRRCLVEVNSRDYPAKIIDKMCRHFTPGRFRALSRRRPFYVAETDQVVGTVSRDGNKIYTMFVDPDHHGAGIGRRLLHHVESLAIQEGFDYMETGASITGHEFYLKLGYIDVRESETNFGLNYILRKRLT